jgi:hypothetical protein
VESSRCAVGLGSRQDPNFKDPRVVSSPRLLFPFPSLAFTGMAQSSQASYASLQQEAKPINPRAGYNPARVNSTPWYKKPVVLGLIALAAVAVIVGAVVGGVVGSRNSKDNNSDASSSSSAPGGIGHTNQDPNHLGVTPSFTQNPSLQCGSDPDAPQQTGGNLTVRASHPRLFAPQYRWNCLPSLISKDPYLKQWNDTIFQNATRFYNMPPTPYVVDPPNEPVSATFGYGGSGVLDVARQVQLKLKHLYVVHLSAACLF